LSGASGRGSITAEEREFLGGLAGDTGLPVRGTAAALGHSMECAFLQNLVLAVATLERGALFPPLDEAEALEAEFAGRVRQVLVTSWGHLKGEGMALVEAIDG
jgi:3-oxoacyl-[acyl-carrier-protein] synthase II